MNYLKQVKTVTLWEYRRFYKPKNELLGIVIMLVIFSLSYLGMKHLLSGSNEKVNISVNESMDTTLVTMLSSVFEIDRIQDSNQESVAESIVNQKKGIMLIQEDDGFTIKAWKKPKSFEKIKATIDAYTLNNSVLQAGLSMEDFEHLASPASIAEQYFAGTGRGSRIPAFFFAGLMILAIFLSFAYQFTAITGEKQLRITEQIVSAIKPQVWMDGKILGITLTGLSSMLTYTVISVLGGMLYFQFAGVPVSGIAAYIHLPSIVLFFLYSVMGILIWNAAMAAIASVITDPNNSAKSSLMMIPLVFVISSFLVLRDPDSIVAVFLSWFPLTSASAMPMLWVVGEVPVWHLFGSFALLLATFYTFRKVAAKVFRVSILMSGKEPTWGEVWKMTREELNLGQ